mgnify:FL=1
MAKKFNLGRDKSNEKSLAEKADILDNKSDFDLRFIEIDKIVPNPNNFYELSGIKELSENIKEFGLNQNLEVVEIDDNGEKKYRLIGGHRRYEAIKLLISDGNTKYKKVPCKVNRSLNEIEEQLRLIKSNSDTRELTPQEKREQMKQLIELYKKKQEITGEKINIKKEVAAASGTYPKTVERYDNINNRLIDELKEYFDSSKITFTDAYNFATLTEEAQLAILDLLKSKDKVTKEELKTIKEANKQLSDENKKTKKALEEKENLIHNLELEKKQLSKEQADFEAEKEKIAEEKAALEEKIRTEITKLSQEQLLKIQKDLVAANEKTEKLSKKEKQLSHKLSKKDLEIEKYKKKLEEEKALQSKAETATPSNEQFKKAIAKSKIDELKVKVIYELDELTSLAKENQLVDETEDLIADLEKALESIKSLVK